MIVYKLLYELTKRTKPKEEEPRRRTYEEPNQYIDRILDAGLVAGANPQICTNNTKHQRPNRLKTTS
jgi:hypothetical protein